jgi:hypothetical protein
MGRWGAESTLQGRLKASKETWGGGKEPERSLQGEMARWAEGREQLTRETRGKQGGLKSWEGDRDGEQPTRETRKGEGGGGGIAYKGD